MEDVWGLGHGQETLRPPPELEPGEDGVRDRAGAGGLVPDLVNLQQLLVLMIGVTMIITDLIIVIKTVCLQSPFIIIITVSIIIISV